VHQHFNLKVFTSNTAWSGENNWDFTGWINRKPSIEIVLVFPITGLGGKFRAFRNANMN